MSFIQRMVGYVVNEVLVESLANRCAHVHRPCFAPDPHCTHAACVVVWDAGRRGGRAVMVRKRHKPGGLWFRTRAAPDAHQTRGAFSAGSPARAQDAS